MNMKTNKEEKPKKRLSVFLKNLALVLGLEIVYLIVAYIVVYLLWCQFSLGKIIWDISIFQNKSFQTVCVIGSIALCFVTLYTLTKYNLISFSKIINKVERAKSDAYGSTRWQTLTELHANYGDHQFSKLNTIPAEGYIVNSHFDKRNELRVSMVAEQHSLIVGTAGTGKSLFFLGPTIQANAVSKTKVSMVINDLKGELYSEHSLMLKNNGYDVIKIDLRNPHTSDRYNPLSLIWDLYHQWLDTQEGQIIDRVSVYINEIASILCPIGKGDQQQWSQGAQAIIKSIIWAMLEDSKYPELHFTREMFTILQISNIVNRQKPQLDNFLMHRERTSPVFDFAGMILDNPSPRTVGSYFATLSTALEGFLEPGLQKLTSDTDIDITKLSSKPTAVFIIIPDELKSRNIVGTMIISQIYNYLTFEASQLPGETLPKNVYFLLDEFGNLPIIPNFPSWVALGRSRGIFFSLLVQADSQLEEVYGRAGAKTIMQNCHLQVLLGANEIETLKRFEDLIGKYTIYQRSANVDQTNSTVEFKGSTSLTSKDLVTLDQLQRMQLGDIYFKILGDFPCKGKLVPFFSPKASKFFKSGALTEKSTLGKAGVAIDFDKCFYDLELREAAILTARNEIAPESISNNKPPQPTDSGELQKYTLVDVDSDLFYELLQPAGFEIQSETHNGSVVVKIPEARKLEAIKLLAREKKPAEKSGIEKQIDFLRE